MTRPPKKPGEPGTPARSHAALDERSEGLAAPSGDKRSDARSGKRADPRGAGARAAGKRLGPPPWERRPEPRSSSQRAARASPVSSGPRPPRPSQPLSPELSVFGRHAVEATLKHQPTRAEVLFHTDSPDVRPLVALAKQAGVQTRQVEVDEVDALAGGRERASAQGVVLRCKPFPYVSVYDFAEPPRVTLVLDGVEDPRNLGAAVRAAFALGAGLVVVPADRAAQATAWALKASAGALCRVPVARETNLRRALERLKDKGAWIVGAEADGDRAPWEVDLDGPVVLVVGGEDRGLRRLTREACDFVVAIPMSAPDTSLNAADAATLLLYEAVRQRSRASDPPTS